MPGMKLGGGAFAVGIVLALLVGLNEIMGLVTLSEGTTTLIVWILIILGATIGFVNIQNAESTSFIVAVIGLTLLIALVGLPSGQEMLETLVKPVLQLLVPAAIVVAIAGIVQASRN